MAESTAPRKPLTLGPALEQLVGRLVAEPEFRRRFVEDAAAALHAAALQLPPHDLEALGSTSSEQRERMIADMQERTAQFSSGLVAIEAIRANAGAGAEPAGDGPDRAMEQFIGKVVAEPSFRRELIDDPAAAIRAAGLQLTAHDLRALTRTSREQRQQMLADLQERTAPWAWGGIFVPVIYH